MKKGKTVRYLKNEAALDDYLVELGVRRDQTFTEGSNKPISGKALEKLTRQLMRYTSILNLMKRRSDPRIIDSVVEGQLSFSRRSQRPY